MLDLQQFCSTDTFRFNLHKPFRRNGHVYATNGHILVRVADDERYEISDKIATEKVLAKLDSAKFIPAPAVNLPPKAPTQKETCTHCDGLGTQHDCLDCSCECDACEGKGTVDNRPEISTSLCGQYFALDYIRQLYDLPDLEIAPDSVEPMLFRFTGGIGALMPRRNASKTHIEIES
jgi:hypothetical protein